MKKSIIETKNWDDEPNPLEDMENLLKDLKSQPDFYGKDRAIEFIKNILPDTHPENIDVEIESEQ